MLTVGYNQKNNGGYSSSLDMREASKKAQSFIITERKLYLLLRQCARIAAKVSQVWGLKQQEMLKRFFVLFYVSV